MIVLVVYNTDRFSTVRSLHDDWFEKEEQEFHPVYAKKIIHPKSEEDYEKACEDIFAALNLDDRPYGSIMRSMCHGDGLIFITTGTVKFYTCEAVGFKEREHSTCKLSEETYLFLRAAALKQKKSENEKSSSTTITET